MTAEKDPRIEAVDPMSYQRHHANRSKSCHCCGLHRVRQQLRIGTPTDPDFLVAVCPTCDTAPEREESTE